MERDTFYGYFMVKMEIDTFNEDIIVKLVWRLSSG